MNDNNNRYQIIKEGGVAVALVVLAVLAFNPFHFWMPDLMLVVLLGALVLVFSFFAIFVWQEGEGDEREVMNRLAVGRIAYLCGAGVLIAGIIVQLLRHAVDGWLVAALVAMIVAKSAGLAYHRLRK